MAERFFIICMGAVCVGCASWLMMKFLFFVTPLLFRVGSILLYGLGLFYVEKWMLPSITFNVFNVSSFHPFPDEPIQLPTIPPTFACVSPLCYLIDC